MTLLVSAVDLIARRAIARGSLSPLSEGLRNELAPLIDHPVDVPRGKALLSRRGGRCEVDGAYLTFDPHDPRHRCPLCSREYHGELHDRFRLYWYQLWLAERTVHGALLGVLADDVPSRDLSVRLLEQYTEQYLRYPNADNVLGPSRPFFSTYLESIWLLQLTIALSLLEAGAPSSGISALGGRVRERLILPSATLIASYDEGMSNRQVWNNAALMASARLLDDRAMFERVIHGPSGMHAHLNSALLGDGTWYEGENYHLFAHRGLWYGERLANLGGDPLPRRLEARYREAFAAPFRTVLPDLTYPSRRDSQYAVSIRQPRFAESCELGLTYGDDERLTGILGRLYDPGIPRGETGRHASSADVERNLPGTGLRRTDLSWRTLLCARQALPALVPLPLQSDLLPEQGLGIIRRDGGEVYVSLDYGNSGGGHGHPDRLNLTLMDGDRRWFDDPGTGSYVDPTLHWYRSTLAHNAPLFDGHSQPRVNGALNAFKDTGDVGWIVAHVAFGPGLLVHRSVVVLEDYLVDKLEWKSIRDEAITLPVHGVTPDGERIELPEVVVGGNGAEDGFEFLADVARVTAPGTSHLRMRTLPDDDVHLDGWTFGEGEVNCWTATAPAPPNVAGRRPLALLRQTSASGAFVSVWSWRGSVVGAQHVGDAIVVERKDGSLHRHISGAKAWTIEGLHVAPKVLLREYADAVPTRVPGLIGGEYSKMHADMPAHPLPATFQLGAQSYRRSELTWDEAGKPRATLSIAPLDGHTVVVEIEMHTSQRHFLPFATENTLDNETASINGDSIQLYAMAEGRRVGVLMVPGPNGVETRPIDGWFGDMEVSAEWEATGTGYRLTATLHFGRAVAEVFLDVIVNETTAGRERRRGQLVLSGGAGEFVYLRGDRHDPSRLLRFILPQ